MKSAKILFVFFLGLILFVEGSGSDSGALLRNLALIIAALWVLRRIVRVRRRGTAAMRQFDSNGTGSVGGHKRTWSEDEDASVANAA